MTVWIFTVFWIQFENSIIIPFILFFIFSSGCYISVDDFPPHLTITVFVFKSVAVEVN